MRPPLAPALALALVAGLAGEARAQALVADLSEHLVKVTTGFVGTDLLLFGAIEEQGDVVVVVKGPPQAVKVRRKARVAGIWVNRDEVLFENVPAYYAVASSEPLPWIASEPLRARHQIGTDRLAMRALADLPVLEEREYRDALVRAKERAGVFAAENARVQFLGNRLFRTRISFPSNVPTGTYTVTVFLVRDDRVISAQTTPLLVSKTGIGADVFTFAHRYSALYGIASVLIALFAGWLAGAIFRRT